MALDEPLEPERYPALPETGPAAGLRRADRIPARLRVFGYNSSPNILNELSFRVETGQMVAFAGPSGGGKSTIFKLLLGCYPPRQGEIQVAAASPLRLPG